MVPAFDRVSGLWAGYVVYAVQCTAAQCEYTTQQVVIIFDEHFATTSAVGVVQGVLCSPAWMAGQCSWIQQ